MRKSLIVALSLFGLFDSLYLWWVYTSPSHPLVCLGTGCDVVRASPYAHWRGLPLPAYGAEMYAVLVLLVFAEALAGGARARRVASAAIVAVAAAGFLVSAYLSGLEAFVIHAWCAWCVASAVAITLILALAVWDFWRREAPLEASAALARVRTYFVLSVVALAAGIPSFLLLRQSGASPSAPAVSPVALEERLVRPDSHATGNLDSPVTLVEFGDFQCPFCAAAQPVVETILKNYGDRVRFVFRHFPVRELHIHAETAAEASECAAAQGKFWQAERMFYQHQSDLSEPALERYAAQLGLNTAQFDQCLTSGAMAARVQQDVEDAKALGVHGPPTFFLDHQEIVGVPDYHRLAGMIDRELAARGLEAAPGFGAPAGNVFAQLGGSALACSPEEAKLRQPTLIHTAEAERLFRDRAALFVDVRPPADFAAGHIPGAVNVPVEEIEARWSRLPRDQTIVLYESGRAGSSPEDACAMSRGAGRVLLSHGFASGRVKVYQEGFSGWEKAGLAVER
jgi:protein-disulfide isomerase/rhodanese-related sulfurtransferase/uncharacterized membrane protein